MKPEDLDSIREVIQEEIAAAELNVELDAESVTRLDEIEREVRELSDKIDIVLNILTEEKGPE